MSHNQGSSTGKGGRETQDACAGSSKDGSGDKSDDKNKSAKYHLMKKVNDKGEMSWQFKGEAMSKKTVLKPRGMCLWCEEPRYFSMESDYKVHTSEKYHIRGDMLVKATGFTSKYEEITPLSELV